MPNFFRDISNYNKGDPNSKNILSVDFTNFDSSNIEKVNSMFYGCTSLEEINLDNFQTSGKIEDMSYMFYGCTNLKLIDLSKLITSSVENMNLIFSGCNSLKYLDISNFDMTKLTNADEMFNGLDRLEYINIFNVKTGEEFNQAISKSKLTGKEGLMACQKTKIISNVITKCCWIFREVDTCAQTSIIIANFNHNVS